MPIVDFSSRKGNNLIFRELSDLTEIVQNKRYRINDDFYENSLMVFLNGQRLVEGLNNDYIIISPNIFELTFTKHDHSIISVGFLAK